MKMLLRAIVGLLTWCFAIAALIAQGGPVVPTWGGPPAPTIFVPAIHGTWSQVQDWSSHFNSQAQGFYDAEVGHGAVITTGSHRGKVLIWNIDVTGVPPTQTPTAETFLVDSSGLGPLQHLPQSLSSDIFCSGLSTLSDGKLLVCGGLPFNIFGAAPIESHLFEPLLIVSGTPWLTPPILTDTSGGALEPRYYPYLIPLTAKYGKKQLCMGGQVSIGAVPTVPQFRIYDEATGGYSTPHTVVVDGTTDVYHCDTYPRAYQMSDGAVFVAGDVIGNPGGGVTGGPGTNVLDTPPNHLSSFPGETFLLPLDEQTCLPSRAIRTARLDANSTSPSPIPPVPAIGGATPQPLTYRDLNYGSGVLLHCLPANGGLDRFLIFGGAEGFTAGFNAANTQFSYPVQVMSRVQELNYSGVTSTWVEKTPMHIPRAFLNAVVLPTREIFLSGGSATDPITNTLGPDTCAFPPPTPDVTRYWSPVVIPEIYDPGSSSTALGTTAYGAVPNPATVSTSPPDPVEALFPWTPRIYHHLSILLQDGSILVCGGNDVTEDENIPCWTLGTGSQTGEVFYPPYYSRVRPSINKVPTVALFEREFTFRISLHASYTLDTVVLIKTAALTHHFDPNQRYIELEVLSVGQPDGIGEREVKVKAPQLSLGPRGVYMLFAVATNGTERNPSKGEFIDLR